MNIKKLLQEHNIQPRKELDQYFLQDDKILNEEIKPADLKQNDVVLEVGAGLGNLTQKICEKCKIIAIEKDYTFRNILKGITNANVIFGDALEVLESLRKAKEAKISKGESIKEEFNKIVSNIPYSISQDLILEFMRHKFDLAVVIVQKEFAQKLTGKDKLGMLMDDCAEVKILKNVSADAFYPKAVRSSLVLIKQKKLMDDSFWYFLSSIYKDRNKDVKNVLEDYPIKLAKKKIHQLKIEEIKELYELNRNK